MSSLQEVHDYYLLLGDLRSYIIDSTRVRPKSEGGADLLQARINKALDRLQVLIGRLDCAIRALQQLERR